MSSLDNVIKVEGLSKRYSGVIAVDGVSFEVARGSALGLIGPNGSGKTTLIDCISGFQKPDEGRVFLRGLDITNLSPHIRVQKGIGRTFQIVRVYENLSLLEHLLLGNQEFDGVGWWQAFRGGKKVRETEETAMKRAIELLEIVNLADYAESPAGMLSYGQRKLLALVTSLIADPTIVFLDEPVAGVNPLMIDEIAEVIRKLHSLGQTFIIIEHNIDFVVNICDKVMVLSSGCKIAEGPPSLIWKDPRVFEAYVGGAPLTEM